MAITATQHAPAIDLSSLDALDWAPGLTCDDAGHDEGHRPPAVWRVRKKHTGHGCEGEVLVLLCDPCLQDLQKISGLFVICYHCNAGAYARDWWRLAGGV